MNAFDRIVQRKFSPPVAARFLAAARALEEGFPELDAPSIYQHMLGCLSPEEVADGYLAAYPGYRFVDPFARAEGPTIYFFLDPRLRKACAAARVVPLGSNATQITFAASSPTVPPGLLADLCASTPFSGLQPKILGLAPSVHVDIFWESLDWLVSLGESQGDRYPIKVDGHYFFVPPDQPRKLAELEEKMRHAFASDLRRACLRYGSTRLSRRLLRTLLVLLRVENHSRDLNNPHDPYNIFLFQLRRLVGLGFASQIPVSPPLYNVSAVLRGDGQGLRQETQVQEICKRIQAELADIKYDNIDIHDWFDKVVTQLNDLVVFGCPSMIINKVFANRCIEQAPENVTSVVTWNMTQGGDLPRRDSMFYLDSISKVMEGLFGQGLIRYTLPQYLQSTSTNHRHTGRFFVGVQHCLEKDNLLLVERGVGQIMSGLAASSDAVEAYAIVGNSSKFIHNEAGKPVETVAQLSGPYLWEALREYELIPANAFTRVIRRRKTRR